jgi:hypothetical protein
VRQVRACGKLFDIILTKLLRLAACPLQTLDESEKDPTTVKHRQDKITHENIPSQGSMGLEYLNN